jgi:spermidine synthase
MLSYVYPVWIKGGRTASNPTLELLMYHGRWQLATKDAIYSDGDKYTPITVAYKALGSKLARVKNVLVLGSGLGSAVEIMGKKGHGPAFTLVDNDEQVLEWAKELMPPYDNEVKLVQADAMFYLDMDNAKYDLLIVDIFTGREVPDFITTMSFMQNCRTHVSDGGSFVLNYIINEGEEWNRFKKIFDTVFPSNEAIKDGINRILIATV